MPDAIEVPDCLTVHAASASAQRRNRYSPVGHTTEGYKVGTADGWAVVGIAEGKGVGIAEGATSLSII